MDNRKHEESQFDKEELATIGHYQDLRAAKEEKRLSGKKPGKVKLVRRERRRIFFRILRPA